MDKINFKFIIGLLLLFIIIILVIIDRNKLQIINESLKFNHIKIYFVLTLIFYFFINYGINNHKFKLINIDKKEHERLKNISHQALFGLIIAIFAHVGLFITPFWLIFFLMYFNILDPIY